MATLLSQFQLETCWVCTGPCSSASPTAPTSWRFQWKLHVLLSCSGHSPLSSSATLSALQDGKCVWGGGGDSRAGQRRSYPANAASYAGPTPCQNLQLRLWRGE